MKTEKILIIDDNEDFCLFIELALKSRKFECKSVNNISSAWKVLESFQPGIIFLDIILPDAFSLDILENIHVKCPMSRIIIMTCWEKENIEIPGYVHGWLFKPFKIDELINMLSTTNSNILLAE